MDNLKTVYSPIHLTTNTVCKVAGGRGKRKKEGLGKGEGWIMYIQEEVVLHLPAPVSIIVALK